jgi:hypothetical protein
MGMTNIKYNSLIELNDSQQSKDIVFCIHTAGGGLEPYKGLASYFEESFKFYGIEEPSIFDGLEYESMEEIASHHVDVIKTVQPSGPYRLFGYCSGGPIAHEVAHQLRLQTEEVESATYFNRILSWYDPDDDSQFLFLKSYLSDKYGISFDSIDWQLAESRGIDYLIESIIKIFLNHGFDIQQSDHSWIKKVIKSLCLMKSASCKYEAPDVDFKVFKLYGFEAELKPSDNYWCDFKSSESSVDISDPKYNKQHPVDLLREPNFSITKKKIEEFILTLS